MQSTFYDNIILIYSKFTHSYIKDHLSFQFPYPKLHICNLAWMKYQGNIRDEREREREPGAGYRDPLPISISIAPNNHGMPCRNHVAFLPTPFVQRKAPFNDKQRIYI